MKVKDEGFRAKGCGFGFRAWRLGFTCQGFGVRDRIRVLRRFRVQVWEFRV